MMRFHAESGTAPGTAPATARSTRFNVFPSGRLCSLRRALLLWLVPLFLLVGAASAAFSYWSYSHMVSEFMDEQMQQLALSVAAQESPAMPAVQSTERVHKGGVYVIQVWGADGRRLTSSWPEAQLPLQPQSGFYDVSEGGTHWRVYATSPAEPGKSRVQVFQSGAFRTHLVAERAAAAIAPVVILLPLALLILWGLSGAMSRAVQDIGRQAAQQDEHSIAELPLEGVPQELRPMVVSFNSLLTRLRDAFAAQRRFVQDAAHELRTPITAVALQLENVRCDLPEGACAQSFAQLEAGVSRSQRLVDQLLKLSRQEAPILEAVGAVDLRSQLHESINAMIALADQRNIDLGLVVAPDSTQMPALRCAPGDLRSVLDNLIENALRYTPEGGVVDVRLAGDANHPTLEVIDTGPGIPPDLIDRVFDRFFRVPGSPARGSGLGLSIAQASAQRCGLRIVLRNRDDRSGLVARVELA